MVCVPDVAGCWLTFWYSLDCRLPAFCAWLRRRCTESMTSFGLERNASPSLVTHLLSWPSEPSTCGNATSACTLGSQGLSATCFTASSPLAFGLAFDHAAASATSPGYVAAIS